MRRARTALAVLAPVLVLALPVSAVAWRASGGSLFVVRTASMGTTAPVGSLVLDRPPGRLHPGEIITFRPPGSGLLFTHRIAAIRADGRIVTRGDANSAPDPWTISRGQVAGRVVTTVRDLGWLVRGLPLLVLGAALMWPPLRLTDRSWRPVLAVSGAVAIATVMIGVLHPLIGSSILTFSRHGHVAEGAVISTGILPLRVTAVGGSARTIADGQIARVATHRIGSGHRYRLRVEPDWEWWWILPLATLTLVPGAVALRTAARTGSSSPHAEAAGAPALNALPSRRG